MKGYVEFMIDRREPERKKQRTKVRGGLTKIHPVIDLSIGGEGASGNGDPTSTVLFLEHQQPNSGNAKRGERLSDAVPVRRGRKNSKGRDLLVPPVLLDDR